MDQTNSQVTRVEEDDVDGAPCVTFEDLYQAPRVEPPARAHYCALVLTRAPIQPVTGFRGRFTTPVTMAATREEALESILAIARFQAGESSDCSPAERLVLAVCGVGRCPEAASGATFGWQEVDFLTREDADAYARGERVATQLVMATGV